MMERPPTDGERIAEIHANVQTLLKVLPAVQGLSIDSEINKRDHKLAAWAIGILMTPLVVWVCSKLGIPVKFSS